MRELLKFTLAADSVCLVAFCRTSELYDRCLRRARLMKHRLPNLTFTLPAEDTCIPMPNYEKNGVFEAVIADGYVAMCDRVRHVSSNEMVLLPEMCRSRGLRIENNESESRMRNFRSYSNIYDQHIFRYLRQQYLRPRQFLIALGPN